MSVIVFAPPQASLPAQAREVATLVNNFDHPLLAQTEDDLQRCIEVANDNIVGLWFVGHSSAAGLAVGEQTMTPATLGQYLSTAGVEWSFYNSCESAMFIEQVQRRYPHDCYANIGEVDDNTAWRTAALVAAKYADSGNINRAVQQVNAPPLRFFPSPRSILMRDDMQQREEQAAGSRLAGEMHELTKAIYELKSEIALLKLRLERVERNGDNTKPLIRDQQATAILVALSVIAVLMAYGLYMVSAGG